jgi:ferredoxin-NADP reductase
VDAELVGQTRRLVIEPAVPIAFVGGQCIVVDTGAVDGDKPVRRAYSLMSADSDGARLEIAVERMDDGAGVSRFLHDAPVGAALTLTGPWGELVPRDGAAGRAVIVASDAGITTAIGLVNGRRFAAARPSATVVWLRTSPDAFLGDHRVRARVPCALHLVDAPPIDHPERVAVARSAVAPLLTADVEQAFAAGDGTINRALLDDFIAAGVPATRDHIESFFGFRK